MADATATDDPIRLLTDLAYDLRLAGSQTAGRLWQRIDPDTWDRTRNPALILLETRGERLARALEEPDLRDAIGPWLERRAARYEAPGWLAEAHGADALGTVAYFSMEFGLSESLPIFSGGLGILAGDHLKSASDLGVPVVGVGLLYQQGYFRQVLGPDGRQLEAFPFNDPSRLPIRRALRADERTPELGLPLPGRTLHLRAWEARVGRTRLLLLDTDDPRNGPWDRGITARLYDPAPEVRLLQEMVLGLGGWRLLEELGVEAEVCHLNEGHAAFAVLARAGALAERAGTSFEEAMEATRGANVFTTHTPVEAAFDRFDPAMVASVARPLVERLGLDVDALLALGRADPGDAGEPFHPAYLALRSAGSVNGVSRLHGRVSRRIFAALFPRLPEAEVPIGHVTNGVHYPTWDSAEANELWRRVHPGPGEWLEHLDAAAQGIAQVSDAELWDFRARARRSLVESVRRRLVRQLRFRGASESECGSAARVLDPNVLTLALARRFATYKRPALLLHDEERFARLLADPRRPVQLLVAGKSHPDDGPGKELVQRLARFSGRPELAGRMVFLEDYDMALAQSLVGGVDLWLNVPRRPAEACGTSGMKVLVNGGLHLSVLDGWWDEAYGPEVGWALGGGAELGPEGDAAQARELYELLEREVVPAFYDRDQENVPRAWIAKVRASMTQLTPRFSSDRMVMEYVERAYLPAARAYRRRTSEDLRVARDLVRWREELEGCWARVRFGDLRVADEGERRRYEVQVLLGGLPPEHLRVELWADPDANGDGHTAAARMQPVGPLAGAVDGFVYGATVPADRPADHWTPRIVPQHPELRLPLEERRVLWLERS